MNACRKMVVRKEGRKAGRQAGRQEGKNKERNEGKNEGMKGERKEFSDIIFKLNFILITWIHHLIDKQNYEYDRAIDKYIDT